MNAFAALLLYDYAVMFRSWVVRFWFFLTMVGGVVAVVVSKNYVDDTSFLMSWALVLYAAMGSLVFLVVATSAVSLELPYVGDALLSRGIAPMPYVLAKLVARSTGVLAMFLVVVAPTAFVMQSQALNNDMVAGGILVALAYWSFLLTVLVFLGITFSVLFSNTLVGVVVLGVGWYTSLGVLAMAYADGFTPQGVLGGLPLVLQGRSLTVEVSAILSLGAAAVIVVPPLAIRIFSSRDL